MLVAAHLIVRLDTTSAIDPLHAAQIRRLMQTAHEDLTQTLAREMFAVNPFYKALPPLTRGQRLRYTWRRWRHNWGSAWRAVKEALRGRDPHAGCGEEY